VSKEALAKVVQRSISDAAFRRQLATDPSGALRGYDLSGDEKSALRSGDPGRLSAFGVEQRMSKAFSITNDGTTNPGSISNVSTSDLSQAGSGALTTGDVTMGNSANATLTAGDDAMGGNAANAANAAVTGGDGPMASTVIPGDPTTVFGATHTTGGIKDIEPIFYGDTAATSSSALTTGGIKDVEPVFYGDSAATSSGALTTGGIKDVEPVFYGDSAATSTGALTTGGIKDVEPVFYGDSQSLSSVLPGDPAHSLGNDQLSDGAASDEGFLPSIGYAAESALDGGGGASTPAESTDGPEIQP